jgi:hypothetical protein
MFPTGKSGNQLGIVKILASYLWVTTVALATLFSSAINARAADVSPSAPQIQGEHLRIEFDRTLHSRVVARFDGHETPLGPFVASEKASIANKSWTEFSLVSQKHDRVTDPVGAGERLTVVGKSGPLTKEVSVSIYDEFPAMAFFDVRYTNTGGTKLAVKGWTNNAYTLSTPPTLLSPCVFVVHHAARPSRVASALYVFSTDDLIPTRCRMSSMAVASVWSCARSTLPRVFPRGLLLPCESTLRARTRTGGVTSVTGFRWTL